jgi:hypothetical protein
VEDAQREKLAAMRAKRQKAEADELEAREQRELEAGELADKLELEGQKRGEDFEIIVNRFGVFAIRKPDHQAITSWDRASNEKKLSLDWQIGILRHYIVSDDGGVRWAQIAAVRPGVCWDTAAAFAKLMGVEADETGKGR